MRESLLRRVAATPDLTLDQMQEELRVRGIRSGAALRRFLKKSIIETGNEQEVRRKVYHAKGLCHCAVMVVVASPAFAQSASKQGAKVASLMHAKAYTLR